MKEFPKHINTKKDVYKLKDIYPRRIKKYLQNAINGYKNWIVTDHYETESQCIKDNTHTYTSYQNEEGEIMYIQKEWRVVPGNILDRLGINIIEANELIEKIKL